MSQYNRVHSVVLSFKGKAYGHMSLIIYEYIDYKKFLSDWRKAEKQRNPGLKKKFMITGVIVERGNQVVSQ